MLGRIGLARRCRSARVLGALSAMLACSVGSPAAAPARLRGQRGGRAALGAVSAVARSAASSAGVGSLSLAGCGLGARVGFGFGLGFRLGLFAQQRLPVGDRDLVVVGMDFAEGQEAVTIAAVVDEGRLQGGLNARHFGEIDVAAQRLAGGQFVVELLYPAVAQDHDPSLLGMRGIDEHFILFHVIKFPAPRRPGGRALRSPASLVLR